MKERSEVQYRADPQNGNWISLSIICDLFYHMDTLLWNHIYDLDFKKKCSNH